MSVACWGLLGVLPVAVMLAIPAARWFRRHRIDVFHPIVTWFHRPVGEMVILAACVGGIVQYGSTKGFVGISPNPVPPERMTELATVPFSATVPDLRFPDYTNDVTNVCLTGIHLTGTSVWLRTQWPLEFTNAAARGVEFYAKCDLAANRWVGVGCVSAFAGEGGVVVELPRSIIPFESDAHAFLRRVSLETRTAMDFQTLMRHWLSGPMPKRQTRMATV